MTDFSFLINYYSINTACYHSHCIPHTFCLHLTIKLCNTGLVYFFFITVEHSVTLHINPTPGTEPLANVPNLKANSSSPNENSKKLEAQEEEPKLKEEKSDSQEKSGEELVAAKLEDVDDDIDDDEDEEDVVSRLIGALTEEDDEDDDRDGLLKSVERKCPYCPDRFHNGIGLANHVRGHLNRVGVSYNVRHFISPEEVNAIEKKFSYQKKKKKGEDAFKCKYRWHYC